MKRSLTTVLLLALITCLASMVQGCGRDEIESPDEPAGQVTPEPLPEAGLAWSSSSCEVVYGSDYHFPSLSNTHQLTVKYSSSNPDVASISSDGTITVLAPGNTVITATSIETKEYKAGSATFILTVSEQPKDEGSGSFTFASTGDPSSDDDISNTTFSRMITITFSDGGNAEVEGDFKGYVEVNGNNVTVNSTGGEEFVVYKLTGTTSNGSFKLYSDKKQALLLEGVNITNTQGSAVNVQSGKRTFVMVEGNNSLSDSYAATYPSGEEDMKAVLFSEGQLIFSGSGTLKVSASNHVGKSGIASDDYLRFMSSPEIQVICSKEAGHGLKSKDYFRVSEGDLIVFTFAATKKGITTDGYVQIEGGTLDVYVSGGVAYDEDDCEYKGSAGIKSDNYFCMSGGDVTVTNTGNGGKGIRAGKKDYRAQGDKMGTSSISGGTLTVKTTGIEMNDEPPKGIKIGYDYKYGLTASMHEGGLDISGGKVTVNTNHGEAIECDGFMTVSGGEHYITSVLEDAINIKSGMTIDGGFIYAFSSGNDAIDSNANLLIRGGVVYAVTTVGAPEVALDAMIEKGGKVTIQNGAVVISYGGIEPNADLQQKCYKMDITPEGYNSLQDEDGKDIVVFKAPKGISRMVVSAPSLAKGLHGVSVSGGADWCRGLILYPENVSGGEESSLAEYIPVSIWDPGNVD